MAIFDLFSKRQKRLRGESTDVYQYDNIPKDLRAQIIHIWKDTLGSIQEHQFNVDVKAAHKFIRDTLCREYGLFLLPPAKKEMHYDYELVDYLLNETDNDRVIDTIELSFIVIDRVTRKPGYLHRNNANTIASEAIKELNTRFKEHGVGYQYENGFIVRFDSELIHSEVMKPALTLLHEQEYAGAQEEFLKAHEHYRKGFAKEALNECLKAFESTMKVICDKRKWQYSPRATSSALIESCYDNGLIPDFWKNHFSAVRGLLEGGVPTGRNRLSGHGQGTQPTEVPFHIVAYIIHMTASAIVFLVKAEKTL